MDATSFLEGVLVDKGIVAADKIACLRELVSAEKSLASVLIDQKLVDEDTVLNQLSEYFNITWVNLNHYSPEEEVIALMPVALCQKFNVFPLFKLKNTLMIATANPSDVHAMDEIRVKTGYGVEPILALHSSVANAIKKFYGTEDSVTDMLETIEETESTGVTSYEERELIEAASDEPIVKLVNLLIAQAIRDRASDIHINPEKNDIRVRYRIDGVLHEVAHPPKRLQSAIISRLKIIANLDIAERRIPQDGRIELKVDNRPIDLRVSTLPTINGENVVMRVLDKGNILLGLDDIGFSKKDLMTFNRVIRRPYGIIFTSGPTGSGKTTTLYASLGTINSPDVNIITLEDPVEYNLPLIRQCQINTKTGMTFGSGMRAILRQDPDVILVGEIRDLETANIAVQAAMTGHLVFSTLHTNDAPGCVVRLSEMGVQPFLVASTMIAALAQRLVRTICPACKEEYEPGQELIQSVMGADYKGGDKFFHGAGCQECKGVGYRGRLGIYELMEMTPVVQEAIVKNVADTELKKIARKEGMVSLREDGILKVKQGITTLDEVLRTTS
jgi:type IV pilus assembly protein PilB